MSRELSTGFVNSLEAQESDEVPLLFVTLTHAVLFQPIRVVNDVVDYLLNGNRFFGLPFTAELLSDEEQPPKGTINIPNVDERIGRAVRLLDSPPRLKIEIYALSDFGDVEFIDGRKTRLPLEPGALLLEGDQQDGGDLLLLEGDQQDNGDVLLLEAVPIQEYVADHLVLNNVQCDVVALRGEIGTFDPSAEPFPSVRATRDLLPGLFR